MKKHGDRTKAKTAPEYLAWASMRSRCSNKNTPEWVLYGGRGITVCPRWESYENFLSDMGRRPSPAHSLDRINTNGNYEPGNARWATWNQQARNRRDTKLATLDGVTKPIAEWCDLLGLKLGTVWSRITRGWSAEEALKPPMVRVGVGEWTDRVSS